jgi:hypothetical protein
MRTICIARILLEVTYSTKVIWTFVTFFFQISKKIFNLYEKKIEL